MTIFTTKLGDDEITVVAPQAGQFSAEKFLTAFPKGGVYGLDVEGTYMGALAQFDPDFEVRLIQFATEDYAWVLDLDDPDQFAAAVNLLLDQTISFCSHTPMDVLAVFTRLGVDITTRNIDTRVLAKMADPDSLGGLDLKTLATKYGMPQLAEADQKLDQKFAELWQAAGGRGNAKSAKGKDEDDHEENDVARYGWSTISITDETYLTYAGMDAIACRRLLPQLAAATGAPGALLKVETWLAGQANRIQARGMVVDLELLNNLSGEARKVADQVSEELRQLSTENPITGCKAWDRWDDKRRAEGLSVLSPIIKPHTVNSRYPDGSVVYEPNDKHRKTCKTAGCTGCTTYVTEECCDGWMAQHGVDWSVWPGEKTDKGAPSLKKKNLDFLNGYPLDEIGRSVFEAMQRHREVHDTLNKTKGVRAGLDPTGRIHPTLKTVEAVTGRMSSTGPNFQNFSKSNPILRGMFIPEPGYTLVTADFDQVELRVVAALAREGKMIDTILAGGDLHQLTVDELAVAGITISRDTAKIVNFLIVYGGGGPALSAQTGVPLEEAKDIVAKFRSRYTAIQKLAKTMEGFDDFITNIAGRRVPVDPNRLYKNINSLIQSSARELLVHAWKRFADEFGRGDMVWFPIHDELVLQVPNDLVPTVMAEIEQCMRFDFMGVPISASAIALIDDKGTSRWMTSKLAEKYAEQNEVAA